MIKILREVHSDESNRIHQEILEYLFAVDLPVRLHSAAPLEIRGAMFMPRVSAKSWSIEVWGTSIRVQTRDPQHEMLLALKYGVK